MSSISTFSGTNSVNGSVLNQNSIKMDGLKVHLCPKCNQHYDFYFRNGTFSGRVPLILHCNHTMCEECIRNSFQNGEVACVDCKQSSKPNDATKLKLQDTFPINFYLLGIIYHTKPNQGNTSRLSLKPAGVSYKNRTKGLPGNNMFALNDFSKDFLRLTCSNVNAFQEKCCQPTCKKRALLRCFECNEVYCEACSHMVHKAARGLQTHKITTLTSDFLPELTEKCSVHNLSLEFNCNTCNTIVCCYCIVQNHSGHNYYQLSFLSDADRSNFDVLYQNAEEKLKRLLFAYQKASTELKENCASNVVSNTENEIAKYFANVHAHLQIIEDQLQQNVSEAKNYNASALNNINSELAINIRNLSGLLNTSKMLLGNSNADIKLNVKVIMERLENSLKLPCYLIGQPQNLDTLGFEHGDLLENLDRNFCVNVETTDSFRLVTEDSLPQDYDTSLPDTIALMSTDDINQIICSPRIVEPNSPGFVMEPQKFLTSSDILAGGLQSKSEGSSTSSAVENWIQSSVEELKQSNSIPSHKIEDRENIIVTHIDTPECFYVQLVRINKFLFNLTRDIDQHVRNFAPFVKNPELNKLYIVKYEVKGSRPAWYRGRIIDIIMNPNGQDQQYCVQFIDYGNSSVVKGNMLREISSSLAQPKPFALQCKLMNIFPVAPEWDAKTMKLMAQIITGSEVIMIVMNNSEGILEVDLISMPHGASVRDALIFVGDAIPCPHSSVALTELTLKTSKPLPKLHKRTERFSKGQSVDVFISHVIDPHNVYVQMADFVHHIAHLSDVMANYYNNKLNTNRAQGYSSKNENIYVPRKDMIVAVHTNENYSSLWYRGTVTKKHDGQGMVDIFLVDIGKSVTVSYTNIRKLAERFRNLECQAILVKMVEIEPLSEQRVWDNRAINFLNKYILQRDKLRMLVYEPVAHSPEVFLFEHYATVDICINALMVQEGIAQSAPGASLQVEWLHEQYSVKKDVPFVFDLLDTIQSTKKTNKDNGDIDEEIEDPNVVKKPINILSAKSPDLIYIAFNDEQFKRTLHDLQLDIQNYYSKHHLSTQNWEENDLCVIFNKTNKLYFRALIIKKYEGNKFLVLLRDTAEEITVDKKDIFVLENQFTQAYERAVRCHMGGITPAGDPNKWSLMAIEFLQKVFQNNTNIYMSKNGPVNKERKSLSVEMWYSEFKPGAALEPSKTTYHSINRLLVKNGLALKQRIILTDESTSATVDTRPPTQKPEKKNTNKKNTSSTKKETNTKLSKARGKNNSKTTKNNGAFKPIDTSKGPPKLLEYYSSDADFVHPVEENAPPNIILESLKSDESNEFTAAINKTIITSLSSGNSTPKKNFPVAEILPEGTESINDWNELIIVHEAVENKKKSESVTDWLLPVPFSEMNFYAFATSVDDNAHIYLHEVKYECGLKEMEEKMKPIFDALPPEPIGTIWVTGQICTVKYFVTNSWYRGKIVEVSDEHIKVFMVDYGNIEECRHDDLRFKVMYTDLPAFANKIQLYKVFPKSNGKWLTSDLDELHKTIVERKIFVMLKGKIKADFIPAAIVKIDDVTINEWMLRKSPNLSPLRVKQPVIQETDDVIIEEEQSDEPEHLISVNILVPSATYIWKSLSTSLENQKVPVGIVNILSFNKFIIEFANNANSESQALFENVSEDIKSRASEQPVLYDLHLGQACVTQFSEDGEWYRGQVYNVDNIQYGLVEIWFVDFGNFESVQRDSIRVIHPDWLELPVQQYVGQIYGLELTEESELDNATHEMSQYCNTVKTGEIISTEPLVLQLYDDNDELCYKDLIEKNIITYRV